MHEHKVISKAYLDIRHLASNFGNDLRYVGPGPNLDTPCLFLQSQQIVFVVVGEGAIYENEVRCCREHLKSYRCVLYPYLFRGTHQFRRNARNCFAGLILDDVHNEPQGAGVDPLAAGVVILKEERLATVCGELMNRAIPPPLAAGGGLTGHCYWYLWYGGGRLRDDKCR